MNRIRENAHTASEICNTPFAERKMLSPRVNIPIKKIAKMSVRDKKEKKLSFMI
ncbi:MAG: hypothetical protein IJO52_03850 [Clostridia bacterium]|nr:hypothetical protein [Clostridia bacterium]